MAAFWGIKNNRLFRPRKDGEARYDPIIMRNENVPNKDSAEWSLLVGDVDLCGSLTTPFLDQGRMPEKWVRLLAASGRSQVG
eukprot:scaffold138497_cov12-Tisochrysis_lutea.AAC.1